MIDIDKVERVVSILNNRLGSVRVDYIYDPIRFYWEFKFTYGKTHHVVITVRDELIRYYSEYELADALVSRYINFKEEKQDG